MGELLWDNPMKVEIVRAMKKFGTLNRNNSTNVVMTALVGVIYLIIVASNFVFRDAIPSFVPVYIALVLITLTGPIGNYQAIAGEREKRTWELLVVSPVTKAQIVTGKWMGAILLCLLWIVLSWLPILVLSIPSDSPFTGGEELRLSMGEFLMSQAVLVVFSLFSTSLTVYFSARSQRSLNALGLTLSVMFVLLVLIPVVLSIVDMNPDTTAIPILQATNPFFLIWSIVENRRSAADLVPNFGIFCVLYLGLSVLLMALAIAWLNRADNESLPPTRQTHA
ncbi:MAG: hypothetical protein HONBIEJF_01673 [Fimbriimonadaceae bacterium]|nr:hypothetical protein [Fimbriimonadaceae bacterium]